MAIALNGLKFYMYPNHFQKWLDFDYGLLIFIILAAFSSS